MNGNVWAWGHLMKHRAAKEFSAWTMLLAGKLPNPAQLVCVLQDTQFWRKGARKKSWWFTDARQNGDTDYYQLLKVTKRHIQNLCIVASQEEPRRDEESLLSCVIAVGAGPSTVWTEASPWQMDSLATTALVLYGRHGSTFPVLRAWGHPESVNKS